jgi:hypothetical protein
MKKLNIIAFFTFLVVIQNSFSQSLSNGDCFYLTYNQGENYFTDSNFHLKFNEGFFQLFAKDSTLVFQQRFREIPKEGNYDFWLAQNEKQKFVLSPKTKTILEINKKLEPFYDFDNVKVKTSPFTKDTVIELKNNMFLNLKGEILVPGNDYYDDLKNKKYRFLTEIDLYLEDLDSINGNVNELSDEEKIKLELRNPFFKDLEFDKVSENELYNSNYFTERIFTVKLNNKYGLISSLGKFILPVEFDKISLFQDEETMAFENVTYIHAFKGKMCYVYNFQGKLIFSRPNFKPLPYQSPYGYYNMVYFDGYVIKNKGKVGLVSASGKDIIPVKYDNFDIISLDNKEFIKEENASSIEMTCTNYPYKNYYVGINTKKGINDIYAPNGKLLNSISFDGIYDIRENGLLLVEHNGYMGLIGPSACLLAPAKYSDIQLYHGGKNIFMLQNDTISKFINEKGEQLFGQEYDFAYFSSLNYALVEKNSKYGLIDVDKSDANITWKIEMTYDYLEDMSTTVDSDALYLAKKNGKYGIIDENQKVYLDFKFDYVDYKYHLPITIKDNKYGLHGYFGKVYLENKYDSILKFHDDFWLIKSENKYAIYDSKMKQIILESKYEDFKYVQSTKNFYIVKENGKFGILNSKFEKLIECKYISIKFDSISYEFECLKEDKSKDCIFVKELK